MTTKRELYASITANHTDLNKRSMLVSAISICAYCRSDQRFIWKFEPGNGDGNNED